MKKFNRILILSLLCLICTVSFYISEAATTPTISANNCTEGENITVTIHVPEDVVGIEGNVRITYSSGESKVLQKFAHLNTSLTWPGNYTTTVPATVAGNATIVVENIIIIDRDTKAGSTIGNLSTTVNIAAKEVTPPPVDNPGNTSTGNNPGNTTNTGNTSSNNSGGTTKPPATTTKPKVLDFKDVNEKVYTTKRINLRQNYGTNGALIKTLSKDEELVRTGTSTSADENGYYWSRVSYNGTTGYVITSGLTTEVPASKVENNTTNQVPENTVNNEAQNNTVNEVDTNILTKIQEEVGVIPEVGNNIMPNVFFGTLTFAVIMMIIVKKNKYLDEE